MKYYGAKGSVWENYIGRVGEWVEVTRLKYIYLKLFGYKVKKVIK